MYNKIAYIKDTIWCLLLLFKLVLSSRRGLRLVLTIVYIIYNV